MLNATLAGIKKAEQVTPRRQLPPGQRLHRYASAIRRSGWELRRIMDIPAQKITRDLRKPQSLQDPSSMHGN
jgi:hypothetical protein